MEGGQQEAAPQDSLRYTEAPPAKVMDMTKDFNAKTSRQLDVHPSTLTPSTSVLSQAHPQTPRSSR